MYIKLKEDRGFTLLEVIIAISILTFGILAVGAMQSAALRGNNFAYGRTSASTLAQDALEDQMALSYDNMIVGNFSRDEGNYTVNWTVTEFGTGTTAYKTITVTVTYLGLMEIRPARLRVTRSNLFA
jgi:prepilin-type N-terminal cleavage/methylation domain-containing protein